MVALLAFGCAGAPSGPVVDAVESYVAGLPAALHGDTLDSIRPVATEDQLDRVRRYVAYVLSQGERMESTVERLAVLNEKTQATNATVESDEEWSVVYRDSESGRTLRVEKYRLRVRYSLVLQDASWRVSDVQEIERTPL